MTPSAQSGSEAQQGGAVGARERILDAAADLFGRHGVAAIGVDRITAEAGVAKMTLYRHFSSKDELVAAVIHRHETLWTHDWLEEKIKRRGGTPEAQLLAVFDVFGEWFGGDDYEGCLFTNCLLESHDRSGTIGAACVRGYVDVRSMLGRLAEEAGVRDPDGFAHQWQILMRGSIIGAQEGDAEAGKRARDIALLLLEREGLPA
jgi:AcrR family transcriptional regulator